MMFFLSLIISLQAQTLSVGSKMFTESLVLAELLSQKLEQAGFEVERRYNMGGSGVLFQALRAGEIHFYPEYTGTITQALIKNLPDSELSTLRNALKPHNIWMGEPLGFNDTWAIAVREDLYGPNLKTLSDLASHPNLKAGFSHEFMEREDGLLGLQRVYNYHPKSAVGMQHSLTLEALQVGSLDITDVYTTEGKIQQFKLKVLEDDKGLFPKYEGIFLAHKDVPRAALEVARSFEGTLSDETMITLNARVDVDRLSPGQVSAEHLGLEAPKGNPHIARVAQATQEHVFLVVVSMIASILLGIPLGILSTRSPTLGQSVLIVSGLLQTIPSLALLCFFIPIFGIGTLPSLVALLLYALLPIVRGVHSGITSIPPHLVETARALGLTPWKRLTTIELPLASINIMGGIKTSAIISVGTATLAAFIGAGGYGSLIVTGLTLNDINTILLGAVPAAVLALALHGVFEIVDRWAIPKGLR